MSALGSLKLMSPTEAKLADTPPVVGFVMYEIYNNPASAWRLSDTLVFTHLHE